MSTAEGPGVGEGAPSSQLGPTSSGFTMEPLPGPAEDPPEKRTMEAPYEEHGRALSTLEAWPGHPGHLGAFQAWDCDPAACACGWLRLQLSECPPHTPFTIRCSRAASAFGCV